MIFYFNFECGHATRSTRAAFLTSNLEKSQLLVWFKLNRLINMRCKGKHFDFRWNIFLELVPIVGIPNWSYQSRNFTTKSPIPGFFLRNRGGSVLNRHRTGSNELILWNILVRALYWHWCLWYSHLLPWDLKPFCVLFLSPPRGYFILPLLLLKETCKN